MRSLRRGASLAAVVGLAAAAACTNKNNPADNDAGVHFPDVDASFDASGAIDTGVVASEAGPGEAGVEDAPADATSYPPSAGSSGAFGVVTVNGKQKLYMPSNTMSTAGNATIAAVDVGLVGSGVTGAPALVHGIDLGTTNVATCTGGLSTMIVAASTSSNDVWFINPSTDVVVKHINLPSTYGQSSFSSGGGYVTGIAADPALNIAILSVWNGYAIVDLGTQTITKVVQAPPGENFGYDSLHHFIYAPFYDCASSVANGMAPAACNTPMVPEGGGVMAAGLSVIDLSDDSVYTFEDTAAMDPTIPVGGEPDSAGVDPTTQIVVVPAENEGYENFIDFSKAVFDKATKTVTAPHVIFNNNGFEDEGVAIEPTTHIAFFEGEGSTDVAALNSVQAMAGDPGYVDGTMPATPGGNGFGNLGDPHGIAVSTSIINGKPVGFVVDSGLQWVARVDLTALQGLEMGEAGITPSAAQMNAVVTYLDSTTSESGADQ
jgi:hypothetical protein